jgi:hypothetical protein
MVGDAELGGITTGSVIVLRLILFFLLSTVPQMCLRDKHVSSFMFTSSDRVQTHLLPFPAPFSPTLQSLEQKRIPHFLHSGKLTPLAPQTEHATCFVNVDASSAAANAGSIVHEMSC